MGLLLISHQDPVNLSLEISSLEERKSVLLIAPFELAVLLMRSKAAKLPCHCREGDVLDLLE